jgi:hypothetical protein
MHEHSDPLRGRGPEFERLNVENLVAPRILKWWKRGAHIFSRNHDAGGKTSDLEVLDSSAL